MDDGHIIEMGSHSELMEKEGTYYRLVKIQTQLTSEPTVDRLDIEKKEEEHKEAEKPKTDEAEENVSEETSKDEAEAESTSESTEESQDETSDEK
jgi:sortase (surface protein transpeptidase)